MESDALYLNRSMLRPESAGRQADTVDRYIDSGIWHDIH